LSNLNRIPPWPFAPGQTWPILKGLFRLMKWWPIFMAGWVLKNATRPHMFLKELELYMDYLRKDIQQNLLNPTDKKSKQLFKFKEQLLNGIKYYKTLLTEIQLLPNNALAQLQSFEDTLLKQPSI
jgi:hypothetical protein